MGDAKFRRRVLFRGGLPRVTDSGSVGNSEAAECGDGPLASGDGAGTKGGLLQLVDDGPADREVTPGADALGGSGLPCRLVAADGVPADFPLEARWGAGVVGQFLVVG